MLKSGEGLGDRDGVVGGGPGGVGRVGDLGGRGACDIGDPGATHRSELVGRARGGDRAARRRVAAVARARAEPADEERGDERRAGGLRASIRRDVPRGDAGAATE